MKNIKLFTAQLPLIKLQTWYNIQKTGLGTKFKEALKITLIKLKQNPFVNAVRYDEVRFALAQTFPYAVHYTIDNTNLAILYPLFLHLKKVPINGNKAFSSIIA